MKNNKSLTPLPKAYQPSLFDALDEMPINVGQPKITAISRIKFRGDEPAPIRVNGHKLSDVLQNNGCLTALELKKILDEADFSEFEAKYRAGGRPPYAPRSMFGIIMLAIIKGITSLRDIEDFARENSSCWYISNYILPDHSVIGRFINLHNEQINGEFFQQITSKVLQITNSGVSTLAGDGTVIEAFSSRYKLIKEEALLQQKEDAKKDLLNAQSEQEKQKAAEKIDNLEIAHEKLKDRQKNQREKGKDPAKTQISTSDPEAVLQPLKNSKDYQASYKPSILANDKRVIVAVAVDPSSENCVMEDLVQQAQKHGKIGNILLDAGYFSKYIIELSKKEEIELLCPEGRSIGDDWEKKSEGKFLKNSFKYDANTDTYTCPAQQILKFYERGTDKTVAYKTYICSQCENCPLREKCTNSARGRTVKRYEIDAEKEKLREKMSDPEIRKRYSKRQAMVEPVFGYIKNVLGLNRFKRKGLAGVKVEFSIHALAYNLKLAALAAVLRDFLPFFIRKIVKYKQFYKHWSNFKNLGTTFSRLHRLNMLTPQISGVSVAVEI